MSNRLKNIPTTKKASWEAYPKLRWVYDRIQLFDKQKVEWYPMSIVTSFGDTDIAMPIIDLNEVSKSLKDFSDPSDIQVKDITGDTIITTMAVSNSVIFWNNHKLIQDKYLVDIDSSGNLMLMLNAWVNLYLKKYTGMVTFTTIGQTVIDIKLNMSEDNVDMTDEEFVSSIVSLYKTKKWTYKT